MSNLKGNPVNRKLIGSFIIVLIIFVSIMATGITYNIFENVSIALISGSLIFAVISGIMLYNSYIEVSENHVFVLETLGRYSNTLYPGVHFILPFGIEKTKGIYMGTVTIPINFDEKKDLDLKDCSIQMSAHLLIKVFNPYLACYAVDDFFNSVKEQAYSLLRLALGDLELDRLREEKKGLSLPQIACFKIGPVTQDEYESSDFYKILQKWGVNAENLIISDLNIPKEIKDEYEKVLAAEKEKDATVIKAKTALIEKEISITKAEADKQVAILKAEASQVILKLEGEGKASAMNSELIAILKELISAGLTGNDLSRTLSELAKWRAILETTNKSLIIDGTVNSPASFGAAFGKGNEFTNGGKNEKS